MFRTWPVATTACSSLIRRTTLILPASANAPREPRPATASSLAPARKEPCRREWHRFLRRIIPCSLPAACSSRATAISRPPIHTPPVKRQGLTHPLLFTRNMVSPYLCPFGAGEPQGALSEVRVEDGRKSKCRPVIRWIGIESADNIIPCESRQTSTGSFLAKHLMNLYRRESK